MEKCEIVTYQPEYHDTLKIYLIKTFPDYSITYIDYCLAKSAEREPSLLVINERGDIVGCHLYYCTCAVVNGKKIETQWGHDTYLDKEYRASIGLEFVLKIHSIKGFGLGLTDVNDKISQKLRNKFLSGVYNYYSVNYKIGWAFIQRFLKLLPTVATLENIKIKGYTWNHITKIEEMRIPYDGYWYKDYCDIDFVRDSEFMRQRFFDNKVFDNIIYQIGNTDSFGYFVVRKSSFHQLPALTVCDFRYDKNDPIMLKSMMEAINILAIKSNLGIVFFVCGDEQVNRYYRHRLHYKSSIQFVTTLKVAQDANFVITGADSDADFLKG